MTQAMRDALEWIADIADKSYETDQKLRADAARQFKRISDRSRTVLATEPEPLYLVWSHEHGAWWGSNCCGYTRVLGNAGRYPKSEALKICLGAGWGFLTPPNEVPVLESDILALNAMTDRKQKTTKETI